MNTALKIQEVNMYLKEQFKITLKHISVITLAFIFVTAFTVYSTSLSDEVEIHCDGEVITVDKTSKSVYRVLKDNGITLGTYDSVEPGLDISVNNVDKVFVNRAVDLTVVVNGVEAEYTTSAETVSEFLKAKGISYNDFDIITPALSEKIAEGMTITITRAQRLSVEETVDIPFETFHQINDRLAKDTSRVVRAGEVGKKTQVATVYLLDGKEVHREVHSESVLKEPVAEIVDVGTNENVITAPDGTAYAYSKVITCKATAYDDSFASNGHWGAITATGKALQYGMVAVDPKVIPLGTRLYIETPDRSWVYGYAVAEDTGGAIKGNRVDLFYPSTSTCMQFGRRDVNVYVLE